MLVLDAETLAKHYVKGSLTRKQFVSLSNSLAQVEQDTRTTSFLFQWIKLFKCPKDLRNYTIKWRVKSVWRSIKYALVTFLMLLAVVIWRIDTDDLRDMWDSGIDAHYLVGLIIEGKPEPLSDDLHLATEYLLNAEVWERQHIKQYRKQWLRLDDPERKAIRNTHWFQEFALLASIKKVEQEKHLASGEIKSVQHLKELHKLAGALS